MTAIAQISAIIRYEILMQWRRRALPVTITGFLIMTLAAIFFAQAYRQNHHVAAEAHNPDEIVYIVVESEGKITRTAATAGAVQIAERTIDLIMGLMMGFMLLVIAAPILASETIPRDRQLKAREWLDALPLARAAYLIGKISSVWSGLGVGLLICAAATFVAARLILGEIDATVYLSIWIVALIPSLLSASAAGVLFAAAQPTRRRAILIAGALLPVYVGAFVAALDTLMGAAALANPLYASSLFAPVERVEHIPGDIAGTLLKMALAIFVIGAGAWAWMRRFDS